MPMASICLGCGRTAAKLRKGRCPDCARKRDRNDPYQQRAWRRTAAAVRERDGGECAVCGSRERPIAHHRHARRAGGPDSADNAFILCGAGAIGMPWRSCHSQYEADKRAGRDTDLTRIVEAL